MLVFASVSDYNARASYPVDVEDEDDVLTVQTKLEDASAKIASELGAAGINVRAYMSSDVYSRILRSVTCAMVDRAMMTALPGLKSRQQTAGPYSFTDSFANPTGDLYLLASERKSLGIGGARISCIPPSRHHCQRRRVKPCHREDG